MTYYLVLEIQPTATPQEIKQAYRRLVKQFHPDLQDKFTDSDRMVQLNAAYEVLGDPQRRLVYDAQLKQDTFPHRRERRRSKAQSEHQSAQANATIVEWENQRWISEVYLPLQRLVTQILNPLSRQINDLAADPFDDQLMEEFLGYLDRCRVLLERSRQLFASQPNPANVAQIAANLYYCLNHLGDGLDDLSLFTRGYDDHHLHTGCELWRLARLCLREAQHQVRSLD